MDAPVNMNFPTGLTRDQFGVEYRKRITTTATSQSEMEAVRREVGQLIDREWKFYEKYGSGPEAMARFEADVKKQETDFTNVTALPATATFTPEQALLSMMEFVRGNNLKHVLVIGVDGAGQLAIRSSRMDTALANLLIDHAKMYSLQAGGAIS